LEAGADWVQIREKDISAKHLLALTREAVRLASAIVPAVRILVNDRLDVAMASDTGVHLGGQSLSADEVVRWLRNRNATPNFLIGVSCHSLEEVKRAESAGADYTFFGPIFDTPSKRSFGAQGLARLSHVCGAVRIPVIAIGGISAMNAADCLRAGAKGVAAIRLFQDAVEAGSVRDLISQLHALHV
jgi:thiamine-phosphate pyrophosphorylase